MRAPTDVLVETKRDRTPKAENTSIGIQWTWEQKETIINDNLTRPYDAAGVHPDVTV